MYGRRGSRRGPEPGVFSAAHDARTRGRARPDRGPDCRLHPPDRESLSFPTHSGPWGRSELSRVISHAEAESFSGEDLHVGPHSESYQVSVRFTVVVIKNTLSFVNLC